ncbi:hypothetical protein QFZ68_003247 [Streptomyces sp. V1I6]|nr:hypothetical protein [Streptomyces sp. V1I6]
MTFGGQNPYRWTGQPQPGVPPQPGPYPGQGPYPGPPPRPGPYPYPPYGPPPSLWQQFRQDEWPPLGEVLRHVRRMPGCLWVIGLLCVWPALMVLLGYPLARSARRQARLRFPAHSYRRYQDPEVWRVQKTRAWVALVASFLILAAYGTEADWAEVQDQYLFRLVVTPWLLLLTAPVVILVLFRLAPPHARPGMRTRLRPAVRSVLWYFGAFTAVPLLFAGVMLLSRTYESSRLSPLITLALLLPVLWVLFFVVFASTTALRTAFNTADAHAALPALLTGVLVWELAAINLTMAGAPPGPPAVQFCAVLGGPASVTAVAWWEISRLRTRYGVTLRG